MHPLFVDAFFFEIYSYVFLIKQKTKNEPEDKTMTEKQYIQFFDTTLRDGEQTPGVYMMMGKY